MDYEELLRSDEKTLMNLLDEARTISHRNFGRKIQFYAPSFISYQTNKANTSHTTFPSISITGSACSLKCKHCGGKVLNTMIPAHTPEELINVCVSLKEKGALGCLISGGCLPDGSIHIGGMGKKKRPKMRKNIQKMTRNLQEIDKNIHEND